MAQSETGRSERFSLRLTQTAKRRIEQAASVGGKSVSACIVTSALENAEEIVRRQGTMALARAAPPVSLRHDLRPTGRPRAQLG